MAKWALVIAGLKDLQRPADKLSLNQNLALAATGFIWVSVESGAAVCGHGLGTDVYYFGTDDWAEYRRRRGRDSAALASTCIADNSGALLSDYHAGELLARGRQLLCRLDRSHAALPHLGLQEDPPRGREEGLSPALLRPGHRRRRRVDMTMVHLPRHHT